MLENRQNPKIRDNIVLGQIKVGRRFQIGEVMLHVMESGLMVAKQATPIFKMAPNDGSFAWSEGHDSRINQPIFTKIGTDVACKIVENQCGFGPDRNSMSGYMRMRNAT